MTRRGEAVRDSRSGDLKDGRGHLRDVGAPPHRVVVVVGLGDATNIIVGDFGGCLSLGELRVVAKTSMKARG